MLVNFTTQNSSLKFQHFVYRMQRFYCLALSQFFLYKQMCRSSDGKTETYAGRVHAAPWWVSLSIHSETNRQTDGQTPDQCMTLIKL